MKVLFINPSVENEILSCNPPIIDEERGFNPPLGILYVAAYLEKHSDHEINVIDVPVEEIGYPQLERRIREYGPDVVGITALTFTMIDVLKTVDIVKSINQNTKVVLGGPHVCIFPEETIDLHGIDYVVLGEGEIVFTELLSNMHNIEDLKKVKGVVFKENGNVVNTGNPDFIRDLEKLPSPARRLVPYGKYTSLLARRSPITTMFTSRGCPYRCTFCYRPSMGKVFRAISPGKVVDEMEECQNMGIKEIFIYDDTFTVQRNRVMEVCEEIARRRLKIGWDIRTRVSNVDREMLMALKKSNCQRIHYGVEAGTEKILKVLKKDIDLDRAIKIFKATKDIGISTFAYFMIGAPEETRDDILKTIDFAKKLDPDYVHITIFTPFPGTEAYEDALKSGIFKQDYWRDFAKSPRKDFRTKYWEGILSEKELQELLHYAYKEFYTRPSYIMSRMLKIRTFEEFKRKAKAGLKLLKA
ncbi:MAG: radical SAM protein [Candidatus Omnitrophota bacterium]